MCVFPYPALTTTIFTTVLSLQRIIFLLWCLNHNYNNTETSRTDFSLYCPSNKNTCNRAVIITHSFLLCCLNHNNHNTETSRTYFLLSCLKNNNTHNRAVIVVKGGYAKTNNSPVVQMLFLLRQYNEKGQLCSKCCLIRGRCCCCHCRCCCCCCCC